MPHTIARDSAHDDLFHSLDGRRLRTGDRSWRLRIHSIRLLHDVLWIQLDAIGTPIFALTLRQHPSADAATILAVLRRYLEQSADASDAVVFDRLLSDTVGA